jgi:hypothetical protein
MPSIAALFLFFDQYTGANVCFALTAFFLFAKITHVGLTTNELPLHRLLFTFVLFGLVGVGIVETVRGVNRWAARHSSPEHSINQEPPGEHLAFSVALEALSMSPLPDTTNGHWVVYRTPDGPVLSPVQVLAWLHIVNEQATLSTIDSFSMEAKTINGNWVELIRVAYDSFELYGIPNNDGSHARKLKVTTLDDTVFGRELQPKQTVRGLGIFIYPANSGPQFTREYRITISDTAGGKVTNLPVTFGPENGTLVNEITVLPGIFDLRALTIRPWYETHPRRRN